MTRYQFFVKVKDELPRDYFMWRPYIGKVLLVEGNSKCFHDNVVLHVVKCEHNDEHYGEDHKQYQEGWASILDKAVTLVNVVEETEDTVEIDMSNVIVMKDWSGRRGSPVK